MDLRDRVPGQSLIEELLRQWDRGVIRAVPGTDELVIGDEAIRWYDGVKGERAVATLLESLGPAWTVLHSVPAGSAKRDIDHVAIGPSGVFTINAKNSSGRRVWAAGWGLRLDNVPTNGYVQSALREQRHAEKALSDATGFAVPVATLVTFVQPSAINVTARVGDGIADIRVISDATLLSTLDAPRVLSDEQISRVVEAAVEPRTWHARPPAWVAGAKMAREFDALDEAVGWYIARHGQASTATAEARPVHATQRAAARVRPTSTRPPQRPATSPRRDSPRRSRPRPRRRSALEGALGAILPFAMLLGAWFYLTHVLGR